MTGYKPEFNTIYLMLFILKKITMLDVGTIIKLVYSNI